MCSEKALDHAATRSQGQEVILPFDTVSCGLLWLTFIVRPTLECQLRLAMVLYHHSRPADVLVASEGFVC